jgi:hypothetical protein
LEHDYETLLRGSSAVASMHWTVLPSAGSMCPVHSAVLLIHSVEIPSVGWPMDQAKRSSAEKPMH